MEVNTQSKGFFIQGESSDTAYINVRDLPHHKDERDFINSLWGKFKSLADKHFLEDAKNHFQERFWEMYLAVALMERGVKLISVGGEGPEFYFKICKRRVFVEAIAPGPGTSLDQVPGPKFGEASRTPTEKILLRFTHALEEKRKKYLLALDKGIITHEDGYILAINSREIHHGAGGNTLPFFIQAYLPIGPLAVAIDPKTLEVVGSHYQYRNKVSKQTGTDISTNAFLDPNFQFVSAILHSRVEVDCVNRPYEIGFDFDILHNPKALHKFNPKILPWFTSWIYHDDELSRIDPSL